MKSSLKIAAAGSLAVLLGQPAVAETARHTRDQIENCINRTHYQNGGAKLFFVSPEETVAITARGEIAVKKIGAMTIKTGAENTELTSVQIENSAAVFIQLSSSDQSRAKTIFDDAIAKALQACETADPVLVHLDNMQARIQNPAANIRNSFKELEKTVKGQ